MAVNVVGLNIMANAIANTASLELVATVGTVEKGSESVTFGSASNGTIEITGDVTIAIASGNTIDHVYLRVVGETLTNNIASATTSKSFPDGGNLIIESYEISVV